ncbi:MAG: hypothetical protein WAL10_04890 [Acetobacteraceae bacterium]|jgi:hypothetical protein
MTAAANAPDPSTQPSRSANLLGLVRKLIDYGRELAATIRRRAFADPGPVMSCFGTADVALILARVSRGLHRANALDARLLRNANRLDAAPRETVSRPAPRAPRPATAPAACETDARLAHLPTPEQIAAKIRRQPIGAVLADICRDLGILPSHPLWRELQVAIIRENGNFAGLVKDILDQAFPISTTAPPRLTRCPPAPLAQFPAPVCTGPP